jgi:transcriptional regulator
VYIPDEYRVDDEGRLWDVVRDHSFATLVSAADGEAPVATLVPHLVVAHPDGRHRLWAHMAAANRQWRTFHPGRQVLSIFRGPDAYISPSWYVNRPYVPTWNFVAVHVSGVPRLLGPEDQAEKRWVLEQTVEQYERRRAAPWRLDVPESFFLRLMEDVVAFEIELGGIEGQFKLSQDKPEADRRAVVARLAAVDDPGARQIARLMQDDRR